MLNITGYDQLQKTHEGGQSLIFQARRQADNQPVLLKLQKNDRPTPEELAQFRREYQITQQLKTEGIIQVFSLENFQNRLFMVVEDFGGRSLREYFKNQLPDPSKFLELAAQISRALAQVHAGGIIHKDINPANIVWDPGTGQLKLIDFGISTELSHETQTAKNPGSLEGTLTHMSPEQTGRMNRAMDQRTDLYSLGVTFHEILTGQLPFASNDPMELVHAHLAKQPVSPRTVIKVPPVCCTIYNAVWTTKKTDRFPPSGWPKKTTPGSFAFHKNSMDAKTPSAPYFSPLNASATANNACCSWPENPVAANRPSWAKCSDQ